MWLGVQPSSLDLLERTDPAVVDALDHKLSLVDLEFELIAIGQYDREWQRPIMLEFVSSCPCYSVVAGATCEPANTGRDYSYRFR